MPNLARSVSEFVRLPSVIFLLVAMLAVGACNEKDGKPGPTPDARTSVIEAAERTLDEGPARIDATVRSRRVSYELDGRLDPAGGGYRFCAVIVAAPSDFFRGGFLWLAGRAGSYATLTTRRRQCARRALWFDDHPPTLQLHEGEDVPQSPDVLGAEDFLHAALVALTGLGYKTVTTAQAHSCGRSQCYRIEVNFEALDRKPSERDEDGWTLRPLVRSLGRHSVALRVDRDGFLDRLSLTAPGPVRQGAQTVRVGFELAAFGEERPVPLVHARAIE